MTPPNAIEAPSRAEALDEWGVQGFSSHDSTSCASPDEASRLSKSGVLADALNVQAASELRRALQESGYTQEGLTKALGQPLGSDYQRRDLPLYSRRLEKRGPLSVLISLFLFNERVEEATAQSFFPEEAWNALLASGLVLREEGRVFSLASLDIYQGLYIFHDRTESLLRGNPSHILGVNPTSNTLANLTVRAPFDLALDLGAGCGVQALLMARHCQKVIAVDVNRRALQFAEFNAALNGAQNIEFRLGSLFEPVQNLRFDLITCNPPFVISPENRFTFRDGGGEADQFCAGLVRELTSRLTEDGWAVALCNWAIRSGQEWSDPVREWTRGTGCNAWFLNGAVSDPLTYAAFWNRTQAAPAYEKALDEWLEYFRRLGIERIGHGAVVLRKRSGAPNWFRAEALPRMDSSAGAHVARIFAAEEFLRRRQDDEALLAEALTPAPDHFVSQKLSHQNGGYGVKSLRIQLGRGLQFEGDIDGFCVQLISLLNPAKTLDQAVDEVARATRREREKLTPSFLNAVRQLIRMGFLLPASDSPSGEDRRPEEAASA